MTQNMGFYEQNEKEKGRHNNEFVKIRKISPDILIRAKPGPHLGRVGTCERL